MEDLCGFERRRHESHTVNIVVVVAVINVHHKLRNNASSRSAVRLEMVVSTLRCIQSSSAPQLLQDLVGARWKQPDHRVTSF